MSMNRRIATTLSTVSVLAGTAALASGCGSGTSTAAAPPSSAATTAGRAAAQAAVQAAAGPVKFVSPGAPVDAAEYRGKQIWLVSADTSLPFVVAVVNGMKQAVTKAGLSLQVYNGQGSTSTEAAGVQQAIAAKAGAIILFGINVKNVATAVKAANAAHIPVVGRSTRTSTPPSNPGPPARCRSTTSSPGSCSRPMR
jgi:ribose transport system substrate-binding protein